MKTPLTLLSALTLLFSSDSGLHAQSAAAPVKEESISIYIIDDATGPELELKHGIKQLGISDLTVLVNGVAQTRKHVRVCCAVVDDDASDNATAELAFAPFPGGRPPEATFGNLPLQEFETKLEAHRKLRNEWLLKMRNYRLELMEKARTFIHDVTTLQTSVSARFDEMLASRNGVDFPRSDIVPIVLAAGKVLGTEGTRVLLINSDMVPATLRGTARSNPFQAAELDPLIHVVFCNVSKIPDASPLFQGLPNAIHHADNLTQAMELVLTLGSAAPGVTQTAAATPSK